MKRIIILLTLVLILLIPTALFRPILHLVKGESMEPTIRNGQFILSVIPSRIERGDVVIVKAADQKLVKRVIGVPGDSIQILYRRVYINGEMIDDIDTDYAGIAMVPIFLADGEYFILGDNLDNSLDSRYSKIGVINERQILRKVIILNQSAYARIYRQSFSESFFASFASNVTNLVYLFFC